MNKLFSGKEVIARIYDHFVDAYQPKILTLPHPVSIVAGRSGMFGGTILTLSYTDFAVVRLVQESSSRNGKSTERYYLLGKGEQLSQRSDQNYVADLLGISLQSPDLTAQDITSTLPRLPRFRNLSQSLLQASATGALTFDSKLSQIVGSRIKEILSYYIVHSTDHLAKEKKFEGLDIKYRSERIAGGEPSIDEESEEDSEEKIEEREKKPAKRSGSGEKRKIEQELSAIITDCLRNMTSRP